MNVRATPPERAAHQLQLGGFVLDRLAGELLDADGQLAGLRRQALEVLLVLGQRAGQVVGKDELMRLVWPEVVVGDGSLTQAIADIRRVLGDTEHRIVRNVARRGYLLVADTARAGPDQPQPVADATAAALSAAEAPAVAPVAPDALQPSALPPAPRGRSRAPALAAAILCGALVVAAWLALRPAPVPWQTPAAAARPPLPADIPALSIAVMPLTVDGDAADAGWLADALHGDLITELQRGPDAFVIGRDTMATFKGNPVDPRQLARDLGVRHVVRGSLRREGDEIRLNLALIDGESGVQRWADTFVAARAMLPSLLNEFAVRVERALQPELIRVSAQRREALSPDQLSADDLAIRANALWFRGMTRDNVLQGLAMVERAVQLDPESQRAWNAVAYLNLHASLNGWQPDRALALARIEAAAAQLERISREHYNTYNAKTIILFWKHDVEGMLRLTREWTTHHPNYPQAHGAYGAALMFNGHFDDAVRAFERALRLSPRDTFRAEWQYRLAMAHFAAARHELARDWAQTAATTNPGLRWPPVHAAALVQLGRHDAAREAVAAFLVRHRPVDMAHLKARMPGQEPRFSAARERLMAALVEAGMR
jgi:TolB-like protein/DNA-binding winged helix-turn-helix (wHTH) protein